MDEATARRIVLLGKTGAGKSSLANSIFRETVFTTSHSPNSQTSVCQAESKVVEGRHITLIDTPGFFDTEKSEDKMKPEIIKCIIESAPGPHAFLIVLKVEKYTEQEKDVITKMCQYFSPEALKYAAVVFTHGEQLPEGMKIQDFVSQNKALTDLVKKCGGSCHVTDNKYWDKQDEYRSNHFQVTELLNTIDKMVMENNGSCYTNEILQALDKEIQEEEERIRKSSAKLSQKETREKAKISVFKKNAGKLACIKGVMMAAIFFGGALILGIEMPILMGFAKLVKTVAQAVNKKRQSTKEPSKEQTATGKTAAVAKGATTVIKAAGAVAKVVSATEAEEGAEGEEEAGAEGGAAEPEGQEEGAAAAEADGGEEEGAEAESGGKEEALAEAEGGGEVATGVEEAAAATPAATVKRGAEGVSVEGATEEAATLTAEGAEETAAAGLKGVVEGVAEAVLEEEAAEGAAQEVVEAVIEEVAVEGGAGEGAAVEGAAEEITTEVTDGAAELMAAVEGAAEVEETVTAAVGGAAAGIAAVAEAAVDNCCIQ